MNDFTMKVDTVEKDETQLMQEIEDVLNQNGYRPMNIFIGLPTDNKTLVLLFENLPGDLSKLNQILCNEEGKYAGEIEQVALLFKDGDEIVGRMIGGEMCGNGALIIGECIRMLKKPQSMGIRFRMQIGQIYKNFVTSKDINGFNILGVPNLIINIFQLSDNSWKVEEDGIGYIVELCEVEDVNSSVIEWDQIYSDQQLIEEARQQMLSNTIIGAGGLIKLYIDPSTSEFGIVPTVIVEGISEMVEKGCFTGTAAACEVLKILGRGKSAMKILQPSGNYYIYYPAKDRVVIGNMPKLISRKEITSTKYVHVLAETEKRG